MTSLRSPLRQSTRLLLCLLGLGAGAACSTEEAMNAPRCDGGSTILVAQSVPPASLSPCFERLPEGWSFTTITIDQSGTTVHLDSDRAGDDAATLRFSETCDVGSAIEVPSDLEGAERLDDIERLQPGFRARVFYRFEGGCVAWRFDFDNDASATESVAIEGALRLVGRDELNANIRETFIDEEL